MGPAGVGPSDCQPGASPQLKTGNSFGREDGRTGFIPAVPFLVVRCYSGARWALSEKALFSLNPPSLQQLQRETTQPKEYRLSGRGLGRGRDVTPIYPSLPPSPRKTH